LRCYDNNFYATHTTHALHEHVSMQHSSSVKEYCINITMFLLWITCKKFLEAALTTLRVMCESTEVNTKENVTVLSTTEYTLSSCTS